MGTRINIVLLNTTIGDAIEKRSQRGLDQHLGVHWGASEGHLQVSMPKVGARTLQGGVTLRRRARLGATP